MKYYADIKTKKKVFVILFMFRLRATIISNVPQVDTFPQLVSVEPKLKVFINLSFTAPTIGSTYLL